MACRRASHRLEERAVGERGTRRNAHRERSQRAVVYRQPRYELCLDVVNATDEENFPPIFNGYFGADLVFPEEPVRFRLSASYRF